MKTYNIETGMTWQLVDITSAIEETVLESGCKEGICVVFTPHTTTAIMINENLDPNVLDDVVNSLERTFPSSEAYTHVEANMSGHMKSGVVGQSLTLIVNNSQIVRGQYQGIYLCEFDGPRSRRVHVQIIRSLG